MIIIPIPAAPIKQAAPPVPMPGHGTRLTINDIGYAYNAPVVGNKFRHPFRPSLGPDVLKFSPGLVDVFTPKLGTLKMTEAQAVLKLDAGKVNKAGESWAVLEVEANETTGVLDAKSRIEIVQLAEVNLHDPKVGRQPLALLIYKGKTVVRVFSITMFNLKYLLVKPAPGGGSERHLFL